MNYQATETKAVELTAKELDEVGGGEIRAPDALWASFYSGIIKGFLEAGGGVSCKGRP